MRFRDVPGRAFSRLFDRRRLATLLSLTTLMTAMLTTAPTAAAASPVVDPDLNSNAATGWYWLTNATPSQVGTIVGNGYRIVSIELASSAPTFSVAYVANSGTYGRGFWWYYGLTATQVSGYLSTNNARPTDIEPYQTASGLRFAVAMIANTGSAAKGYWWYYGQTAAQVNAFVAANNARLVDLDRYSTSSGDRFDFIAIPNTGVDAAGWWYYYNVTPSAILSALVTNHARLIRMERTDSGNFDVIMVNAPSVKEWWYYGYTGTDLSNLASQKGARIGYLDSYVVNGTRYFAALLISDVNAETGRIRDLVAGQMTGSWGFYLKKVGGSVVVSLQPDRVFEPASMIKIVHAVTALRQVQNSGGAVSLATPISWYVAPTDATRYPGPFNYANPDGTQGDQADRDTCAYDSSGNALTSVKYVDPLSTIVNQMLRQSDNRMTDALLNRYGFAGINATAALAGMTRSHVYHRIGCPSKSSPQPWRDNELTLRDAGKIYEGVENGTLLDASRKNTLYGDLVGGTVSSTSALGQMITQEAQAAGLTPTEINTFLANTTSLSKGGSYDQCPTSGSCNPGDFVSRTAGGTIWIPFKSAGAITTQAYVWGRYFNAQFNCSFASVKANTCAGYNNEVNGMNTVAVETYRAVVKQALATW
jgi:hypothetical protein